MFAIEFQTHIKNGIIEIPEEYQNQMGEEVRVIVFVDEKVTPSKDKVNQLLESPLKVKDFKPLKRDEIYESKQLFY